MGDRRTFVVHVYSGGPATVQDVRTGREAAVVELRDLADQINRWLSAEESPRSDVLAGRDPSLEA